MHSLRMSGTTPSPVPGTGARGSDRLRQRPEGGLHHRGAGRENTGRVEDDWNVLAGADADRIVAEAEKAGDARWRHSARFGDGHAAAIIAEYQL